MNDRKIRIHRLPNVLIGRDRYNPVGMQTTEVTDIGPADRQEIRMLISWIYSDLDPTFASGPRSDLKNRNFSNQKTAKSS
jgi:hypothetical protein